jgi:RNA polymerase sigma factor (sigma-70 family)
MVGKVMKHAELDQLLDKLARNPERFEKSALKLARDLDTKGIELEIADPLSWRKNPAPIVGPRVTVENQLRAEIENLKTLDREQEARLARRIEFARIRLNRALEEAGLNTADLEGGTPYPSTWFGSVGQDKCTLPPKVCRRWSELHALRTEMVERNLYLVLINVERYAHTTAGRPDLIQEGSAALFRAVDGFDWRRGLLFRTYAVHWLNQAFRSYLYNFGNTVRVPVYLQKAMKHINAAIERLGNPKASVEQISQVSGLGENLVETALAAARSARSLDTPIGDDDDGSSLRDVVRIESDEGPYTTELEDTSLEEGISQALDRLSERERYVVSLRFGIGQEREHTLAEVAQKLGVSLERVRQIQVRAISKMRTPTLRKTVDPFLN